MARFLVVDDSFTARSFIKKILMNAKHEIVAEAENGRLAIDAYIKSLPDIVTMDVDMPVMNGFDASKEILRQYPGAKIILVTSHEQHDLAAEAEKSNVKHYISKPVKAAILLEIVSTLLSTNPENADTIFPRDLENASTVLSKNTDDGIMIPSTDIKLDINPGDMVTVHHYFNIHSFKSVLKEIKNNYIILKLSREFSTLGILESDPVVIGYEYNNTCYIHGCLINSINTKENTLTLAVGSIETFLDKRKYERIPVSLYLTVQKSSDYPKHTCIVRDLSLNGMDISSKVEYKEDDVLELDLYVLQSILPVKAKVVWKKKTSYNLDYGLSIAFINQDTNSTLKRCIDLLKEDYEKSIKALSL